MTGAETVAREIHVHGIVQGVGFRPHVFRLAHAHALCGWVLNGGDGVCIHVEGPADALDAFISDLSAHHPPAAQVAALIVEPALVAEFARFEIRHSESAGRPTTRIARDLPICAACLAEMFDPADRHYRYPYINCTNCGPRYSIIRALPYDRAHTTMADWPMCAECAAEYHDPDNRRFHAQPVACPACGPRYRLVGLKRSADLSAEALAEVEAFALHESSGDEAIVQAAQLLREGQILAVKGVGGYHLTCDAGNVAPVAALRARKYRKEKAFAVMVRDLAAAGAIIELTPEVIAALESAARPIVLAPSRVPLPGVAPDTHDLGVMLPYAPLHYLLFASGAPDRLVMTSGNRSSEPIAYDDEDAQPSASSSTATCSARRSTGPVTATMARLGAESFSSAAFATDSSASRTCARRGSPAAMRPRATRFRQRLVFSRRSTSQPTSRSSHSDFRVDLPRRVSSCGAAFGPFRPHRPDACSTL